MGPLPARIHARIHEARHTRQKLWPHGVETVQRHSSRQIPQRMVTPSSAIAQNIAGGVPVYNVPVPGEHTGNAYRSRIMEGSSQISKKKKIIFHR